MRKIVLFFVCLTLIFMISCEIPQSVSIRGNPHLRLSLGSPFEGKTGLSDYLGIEKIKEMMGDPGTFKETEVYNYTGEKFPGVQTYIIRYPIVEMTLDLNEYVEKSISNTPNTSEYQITGIPDFPAGDYYYITEFGSSPNDDNIPLYRISLYDMAKLVLRVKGDRFGVAIPYSDSFRDNLEIKIPAFGITNYISGVPSPDGTMLEFIGHPNNDEFCPGDPGVLNSNRELEVFVRLSGKCEGTINVFPVFDWTEATINPQDDGTDGLKGTYPIKYNFAEFLGDAEFSEIDGYVYVNGVGNRASMSLLIDSQQLVDDSKKLDPGLFEVYSDGEISVPSYDPPIPLAWAFNAYDSFNMKYTIKIDEWVVYKADDNKDIITADFVIMLPLKLKISNDSGVDGYVKLDLGDAFKNSSNKDLFGREDNEDLFGNIEEVTIIIENKNNITAVDPNKLKIQITNQDIRIGEMDLADPRPSFSIGYSELNPPPFAPEFLVLYKKDASQNYATLIIERDSTESWKFDFGLTISAKVEINQTTDF